MKFTSISKKNQGGLKKINLRKYDSSASKSSCGMEAAAIDHNYKSSFVSQVEERNDQLKLANACASETDNENSLITVDDFAADVTGEINCEKSLLQDSMLHNIAQ